MTHTLRSVSAALSLFSLFSLVACGAKDDDTTPASSSTSTELIENGADGNDASSNVQSLTRALMPEMQTVMGGTAGAPGAASTLFSPSSCVGKDQQGDVITYTLTGCSGPFGLATVTGTVTVTVKPAAGPGVTADIVGTGLQINKGTADYTASAVLTFAGTKRNMSWNGKTTGKTGRGRAYERTGSWTLAWDVGGECVSIDGTATGKIGEKETETTVTGFQKCKDACPASGTLVVKDAASGDQISLTYDGSDRAKFTGVRGGTGSVALLCGLGG